jgi:hypothetical protein
MRSQSIPSVVLLVLLSLLGFPGIAIGQIFEAVGIRALGMAGAFVAVADDGSAVYWNPAGLATGAFLDLRLEGAVLRPTPRQPDPRQDRAWEGSGALVALTLPMLGLSHGRFRETAVVRMPGLPQVAGSSSRIESERGLFSSLVTHQTGISLVQSLAQGVAVGATLKLVRGIATMDAREMGEEPLEMAAALVGRASNTVDVDFGVLAGWEVLRVGFVARNIRAPWFESAGDPGGKVRLERQARLGLAFFPERLTVVAVDFDLTTADTITGERRNVAFGAERWFWERRASFRGGARASTVGEARPVASVGASYAIRSGFLVEGHLTRGVRQADRGWGLAWRLTF